MYSNFSSFINQSKNEKKIICSLKALVINYNLKFIFSHFIGSSIKDKNHYFMIKILFKNKITLSIKLNKLFFNLYNIFQTLNSLL